MKVTIICDSEVKQPGLRADLGFSCLIEAEDTPKVLFDTGASGSNDFHRLFSVSMACPCHCTQHKSEIRQLFPCRYLDCGAGTVIEL